MPTNQSGAHHTNLKPAPRRTLWRVGGWLVLTAVLALSFIGYLTPQMQIQWANFMSMCGF